MLNSIHQKNSELSSEWLWLFEHAIDWDKILPLYPNADLQDLKSILNMINKWCYEKIAPRAPYLDKMGPGEVENGATHPNQLLQDLYKEAVDINFHSLAVGQEYGGMDLPIAINMMAFTFIGRACLASSSQLNFFPTMIDMLERFCAEEDRHRLIPQVLKGQLSGSMALTEAEAGSDIGSLKTIAKKRPDGLYELTGNKIFISNGGGGFSFVLARTQGSAEGIKGISLFLLEQYHSDGTSNYSVLKDEKKMGMKGSFTCQVVFENSVGKLIGEENKGLPLMFHLMNESRIGAGGQALGIMEACLSYVHDYATDRQQFGKNLLQLPLYKRNYEQTVAETDAFRALFADSLNSFSIYHRLDLKKRKTGELTKVEEQQLHDALKIVRLRTPLIKYYGTELAVQTSKKSIQALGGHGLMLEHSVERWHRDSFGPLLYEGTAQIQALMVFKDLMKNILKHPAEYFGPLFSGPAEIVSLAGLDSYHREYVKLDRQFKRQMAKLFLKTMRPDELSKIFEKDMWLEASRIDKFTIHAETICQALCYLENLKVLANHASKHTGRVRLFKDYSKIIHPKMMAIFDDWRQW